MNHHQTRAFVLKTVNYGERDVIVTLLGRDTGRFTAIAPSARSSRKRFGGGLQPLRCLQASFTKSARKDLATLTHIDIITDFAGIETDLEKIAMASYATELVREMSREGDEAERVFDLLEAFYAQLSALTLLADSRVTLRHFEMRLLEVHGSLPSLHCCARCGVDALDISPLRCSRNGEGLICTSCRREGEATGVLEPQTLALLHYYHGLDPNEADTLDYLPALGQARRVIESSFGQLIERELRSRAMLQTLGLL